MSAARHRAPIETPRLSLARMLLTALVIGATLVGGGLVASCGEEGSDPVPQTDGPQYGVRDSAGISIAENPRLAPDSRLGWRVGTEPLVSIGTPEAAPNFQLHGVEDATRLADGRIVVANGGSMELLVFDATGQYLASWGGQGEGPGEFAALNRVRPWATDSLIVDDPERGRISVFDLEGNHGWTAALRSRSGDNTMVASGVQALKGMIGLAMSPDVVIGLLPDGTLFTRDMESTRTKGFWRQDHAYALRTVDGDTRASLGRHPGPQTYSESYSQGRMTYVTPLRHPFGQTTHTAVWGDLAVIGRTESYEIKAYRSDGSLARIVRRDYEPRTPTQAEQDASFRRRVARLPVERRVPVAEVAANVPLVDAFPAFAGTVGDALGHLWVAEFERPGEEYDGTLWTVFDREGRVLGLVETPEGLTVFEIGEDYILAKMTDDLGVEYVRLWGLMRSG